MNPELEVVSVIDLTSDTWAYLDLADQARKGRRKIMSNLDGDLEELLEETGRDQAEVATHLIEVFAVTLTPTSGSSLTASGSSLTEQLDLTVATMDMSNLGSTAQYMQTSARGRVIGRLATGLTSLLFGGGNGDFFARLGYGEGYSVRISTAADREVLYSGLTSLGTARGSANFMALLNQPSPQVSLAASIVSLRGTPFGDELLLLATTNNVEGVKAWLSTGLDIDGDGELRMTPLMAAVASGSREMASLLIDRGAKVDARTAAGSTALLIALATQDLPLVRLLLSYGADFRHQGNGTVPLLRASQSGSVEIVQTLLDSGADVNLETEDGRTALAIAFEYGSDEIVELLRTAGAIH